MFFSTYVLTKRGPLAKIWLAAHWDRRLTRNEVRIVDIRQSVVDIVQPAVPIALRTSGELLVGVVRIYALKVKHLLKDATDATLILRVAPLSAKSISSLSGGVHKKNGDNAEAIGAPAMLDGVLISDNGDIEAVTFDWSGNTASDVIKTGKTDTEALEARFDDIADLLYGSKQLKSTQGLSGSNSKTNNDDASSLLASAWYAVEPTSQAVEELHSTQHDYDEIAKLRADLVAFGDRVSGSTDSKKSSNPSIEKARASGVLGATATAAASSSAAAAAGLSGDIAAGFPLPVEDIDIGVPLPEDHALLPDFMVPPHGGDGDLFAFPDIMQQQKQEGQQMMQSPPAALRKLRSVNVLDLAATTVSAETVQRWMDDRSDIVEAAPRHGPYDAQEAADRATLAQDMSKNELWAVVNAAPLSLQPNTSLRAMYASLLQPFVAQAKASAMPPLHQQQQQQQQQQQHRGCYDDDEQMLPGGDGILEMQLNGQEGERDINKEKAQGRKRGRDEMNGEEGGSNGLSAATLALLGRIRDELASAPAKRDGKKTTKRQRKESAANERFCLLRDVCRGMHRREAARAFVGVLTLASKQLVSAQQTSTAEDVELRLLPAAEDVLLVS